MRKKETSGKRTIIFDIILVAVILALGLSALVFLYSTRRVGSVVRVSVDGETVGEYSLYTNAEYTLADGTNVLVIEDGVVYMRHADCPDKTCIKRGKIRYIGEDITCLPNRVRAEILE